MDARKVQWHKLGLNVTIGNASQSGVTTIVPASVPVSYGVYNATTGTHLSSKDYTLQPPIINYNNGNNELGNVINEDERVIDWSKSGVVKIMCCGSYLGTGFVVGAHTIATAGHCVYDSASSSEVVTGIKLFDSDGEEDMTATPVEIYIPTNYVATTCTDYAMITVEKDLSSYACFNLSPPLDYSSNVPITLETSGFPQTVNNTIVNSGTIHNKYSAVGSLTNINNGIVYYTTDTTPGSSGSPVYNVEQENGITVNSVVAIHTGGATSYNLGTRITEEILRFFYSNPYINY